MAFAKGFGYAAVGAAKGEPQLREASPASCGWPPFTGPFGNAGTAFPTVGDRRIRVRSRSDAYETRPAVCTEWSGRRRTGGDDCGLNCTTSCAKPGHVRRRPFVATATERMVTA